MIKYLRRASLVCAIALTILLLWAAVALSVGEAFAANHHRSAHLISYAILALTWRVAVAQIPTWIVTLFVIGFAVIHEGIEIFGHAHPYEIDDAFIDAIGAIIGVVGMDTSSDIVRLD
jgi:hypothetical protein